MNAQNGDILPENSANGGYRVERLGERHTIPAVELLRYALDTGDDLRLLDAFMLVAWIRGVEALAVESFCESHLLFTALSDSQHPDMTVVRAIAERLAPAIPENAKN